MKKITLIVALLLMFQSAVSASDFITVDNFNSPTTEMIGRSYICTSCGNDVPSGKQYHDDNGNLLCSDCYMANLIKEASEKVICQYCKQYFNIDEIIYIDDDTLCESCYDKLSSEETETTLCFYCEEEITSEEYYDEDENVICKSCYDELSQEENNTTISSGEYIEFNAEYVGEITTNDTAEHYIFEMDNSGEFEFSFHSNDLKGVYLKFYNENRQVIRETNPWWDSIAGELSFTDTVVLDEGTYYFSVSEYSGYGAYSFVFETEEKIMEIECPYCGETFEDNEDIYNDDGYAVCLYCDEYIDDIGEMTDEISDIDFAVSDWAMAEVIEAYQNNLIPNEMIDSALYKTISREEFAAVAVKLYESIVGEIPSVDIDDTPFTDCNYASEYNNYIAVAYELGITYGTTETTFSPYENITREQLATMLCRTFSKIDFRAYKDLTEVTFSNEVSVFSDDNSISEYAYGSVYLLSENGIIKGVGNNRFAPQDTATKEQAILIALRIYNNYYEW